MMKPHEIAAGDQHFAKLNRELDRLVTAYADDPDGYLDRLDGFSVEFASGGHFTSTALQLKTLSDLLATAIHRLAGIYNRPANHVDHASCLCRICAPGDHSQRWVDEDPDRAEQ